MTLDVETADITTLYDLMMLRDDTEEDLVGSDLHQDAITEAHAGIAAFAREQGLSWYVSKQVMVIAPMPGREVWHPSPDVYVVPGISPHPRSSYDARVEPIPPFIVEVISPSTAERDLEVKRRSYDWIGVREYLIFDPTGDQLGAAVRAWHMGATEWEPWEPDESGTWCSAVLGLGFRPEGVLLRVIRPDGSIVPTRTEMEGRLAQLEKELRQLRSDQGTP
jgi:Uma2 family endonuclease